MAFKYHLNMLSYEYPLQKRTQKMEIILIVAIAITVYIMINANKKVRRSARFKQISKNKFSHKIKGDEVHQEPLVEIMGPELKKGTSKTVTALLIKDKTVKEENTSIMVLLNEMKVGYLNQQDTEDFIELLKSRGISDDEAIEVKALIYGDWGGNDDIANFKVRLNLPKNITESSIDEL